MYSLRLARLLLSVLAVVILILAGCGRQQESSNVGGDVQIGLQPLTDEEKLVVILTNADGTPMTDATVEVEGNMNHAGMVPVLTDPVGDDADGSADGRYTFPFVFNMLGDWIITVKVDQADGSSFERNLEVRSSEQGIVGDVIVLATADTHASHGVSGEASHSEGAVMEVHDAVARPAPLAGGTGAVYFLLHNHGITPAKLIGGESPASAAVELHTTINDNGVMRMRQITDGIELQPDDAVVFEPGGNHVMLVNLNAPLAEGDVIELTLKFEGADDLVIEVPVTNVGADEEGESSGHSH